MILSYVRSTGELYSFGDFESLAPCQLASHANHLTNAIELTASRRTTLLYHDYYSFIRSRARSSLPAAHLVLVRW